MNAQGAVQSIRMRGWTQQIRECQESGLSIRRWCEENGVSTKTYYYRRKRIREEILDSVETGNAAVPGIWPTKKIEAPVFAALPMPQRNVSAVTVRIGSHVAEIHNGAEAETVESVLRTLARL